MPAEDCAHQRPSLSALALALFAGQFGYVFLTVVGPIKNELSSEFTLGTGMSLNEFEYFYGLMYTAYGLPNFFMPVVAGTITDRIGATKVLMACSLLNVAAGLLQCVGLLSIEPNIVLCGRLLLGFGNESLYVAAVALLGEFLPSKDISYMNGILASGIFVANAAGSLLAVPILKVAGKHGLCAFMGAAALVQLYANLEVLRQRRLIETAGTQLAHSKLHCEEVWPLLESCQVETKEQELSPSQPATARGIAIYAIVVFCSSANTVCVWNLYMILCPLLLETWPPALGEPMVMAEERVGAWSFFFMMVPAVGSPIIGGVVAALGCPGISMLLSQCMQTVGLAILSLAAYHTSLTLFSGPFLPLLLVSASNPLFAPMLYQCVTLTVPTKHCAKAFGLMSVMQNVVMGCWPLLVAHLRVISGSYRCGTIAFVATGFVGLVCWCGMLVLDSTGLGGLNTLSKRSAYFDELLASRNKGM